MDHLHTRIFQEDNNTLELSRRICTDQKNNRRVFLPQARPVKEECQLRTRKAAWKAKWSKCMMSVTKGKGCQDHHQLSSDEIAGRNSLRKRGSEGELHVSQSDKGKRIVVMDVQTYYEMAVVHTAQDVEVGWKDLD